MWKQRLIGLLTLTVALLVLTKIALPRIELAGTVLEDGKALNDQVGEMLKIDGLTLEQLSEIEKVQQDVDDFLQKGEDLNNQVIVLIVSGAILGGCGTYLLFQKPRPPQNGK